MTFRMVRCMLCRRLVGVSQAEETVISGRVKAWICKKCVKAMTGKVTA